MFYRTEDITIYIGLDKENNVKILPFVFNKTQDKIKNLSDGNIFSMKELNASYSYIDLIEEKYNTKIREHFSLNYLVKAETITSNELEELTLALSKFYNHETKLKNLPEEKINTDYKNF